MNRLAFSPESVPDPIFAPDSYYYPVIQYMAGEKIVVWPEAWKAADFKARE